MNAQAKKASFLLAISILGFSAPTMQASVPRWAKIGLGSVLVASIFRFYAKKGNARPNRVRSADLVDPNQLENLPTNLWYAFDDALGHPAKPASISVVRDDEGKPTDKVTVDEGYPARGVGGTISTMWKPLTSTVAAVALLLYIDYAMQNNNWRNINPMKPGDCAGFNVGAMWDSARNLIS